MKSTFNICFYAKKDKQKANGAYPLFARITVDGVASRFNTKLDVLPSIWDGKMGKATGRTSEASRINRMLDDINASLNTTGYTPFLWLPRITRLSDRGCMFLFLFSCRYFFMGSLIGGRIAPPCRSCCHTWMHVASASLTFSSCFLEYIHPARLSPL